MAMWRWQLPNWQTLKGAVAKNLEFLLAIRHEIEHRSTNRIDDALGAKLQACAINFNAVLKAEFGAHYGLEKRLPIALQFVNFGADQRAVLKKASGLPTHVSTCIESFEAELTAAEMDDPAYRMKIAFVPIAAKRPGAADSAIEFVKPGSPDAEEVGRIVFKEVNRKRYAYEDWDNLAAFKTSKDWTNTKRLMLLEIKKDETSIRAHLMIGPGTTPDRNAYIAGLAPVGSGRFISAAEEELMTLNSEAEVGYEGLVSKMAQFTERVFNEFNPILQKVSAQRLT